MTDTPTEPEQEVGIPCPKCRGTASSVTHVRHGFGITRRRRVCSGCGKSFWTTEGVLRRVYRRRKD